MTRPSFLRHSGWVTPQDFTAPVNIIGCGAVGSNFALTAAKMGVHKFRLWDLDIVESHNLPNQAYLPEHIGRKKAEALAEILKQFNPAIECEVHVEFFTSEHKESIDGPLVLATDTMKSRQEIYNVFAMNYKIEHVFEIRLGFDYGELNIVDNMNLEACESWNALLVDDSEIPEGPCNQRICTTLVNLVSSAGVHMLCAKYVAERTGEEWQYKNKTIFSLQPQLAVVAI